MKQKKPNNAKPSKAATPAPPSVMDQVRESVAEMRQLRRAQSAADATVKKREEELSAARKALAVSQSATLIADPDAELDGVDSPQSQAFVRASLELEGAKAGLAGVKKRIAQHDIELLVISEKLKAERDSYNAKAIEEFTSQMLEPARAAYAKVLSLAAALGAALGESVPGVNTLPTAGDWHDDAEAVALHDAHSELQQLTAALGQFRGDSERRVKAAEADLRRRVDSPFDPTATYIARRPFRALGRDYAQGEVVDPEQVGMALLGKLQIARMVMPKGDSEW